MGRIFETRKATMFARWDKMAKQFTRIGKDINIAVKAGQLPNECDAQDFAELKRHWDEGQIVEIIAAIGLFGYLNRWNDTMATELEDYPAGVAERTLGGWGWQPGKHG